MQMRNTVEDNGKKRKTAEEWSQGYSPAYYDESGIMRYKIDIEDEKLANIIYEIIEEFKFATNKFPPFHSAHEGFAVIDEEHDELWDEIKGNKKEGSGERMKKEAKQVATMAIRFIYDLNEGSVINAK